MIVCCQKKHTNKPAKNLAEKKTLPLLDIVYGVWHLLDITEYPEEKLLTARPGLLAVVNLFK